jgi:type IV pilus assembly protein PilY1
MRRIPRALTKAALTSAIAAVALVSGQAQALVAIADAPLFITVSVAPNIVLTLDDSGSMARSFVPDICGASGNDCSALNGRYAKSAYGNPLYYNPKV